MENNNQNNGSIVTDTTDQSGQISANNTLNSQQPIANKAEIVNNTNVIPPTVEQSKQDFINNIQTEIKPVEENNKKEGLNFPVIIICFILILLIFYFVFPIIAKNI